MCLGASGGGPGWFSDMLCTRGVRGDLKAEIEGERMRLCCESCEPFTDGANRTPLVGLEGWAFIGCEFPFECDMFRRRPIKVCCSIGESFERTISRRTESPAMIDRSRSVRPEMG
jgi:hypothetical protein